MLKPVIEEKAKEQQGTRTDLLTKSSKGKPIHTRKQVAEAAGVSEDTVRKVEIIEKGGDLLFRNALQCGGQLGDKTG